MSNEYRLPQKGNPKYRIGNDQILEKMLRLYGNPKGCRSGEAPKKTPPKL